MRKGKYFWGLLASADDKVPVKIMWWLRIAHALGFPVVPDV